MLCNYIVNICFWGIDIEIRKQTFIAKGFKDASEYQKMRFNLYFSSPEIFRYLSFHREITRIIMWKKTNLYNLFSFVGITTVILTAISYIAWEKHQKDFYDSIIDAYKSIPITGKPTQNS